MHIKECKLSDAEALQLIKDYTVGIAREAIRFYLDTNSKWNYLAPLNTPKHHLSTERHLFVYLVTSNTNVHRLRKLNTSLPMNYKY